MLLHHLAAPVVCWRQKIVRKNKWGGGGGCILFLCCVYFLVAICIFAGPFLKMIYHRKLEKFADTNVVLVEYKLVSKCVFFKSIIFYNLKGDSQLACSWSRPAPTQKKTR